MITVAIKSGEERQINVLTDKKLAELNKLKSYISAEERELYLKEKKLGLLCTAESAAANIANDLDTSWKWLALLDLPPIGLKVLKRTRGAQFIRDMKLITWRADELYGADWLDRED